MLAVALPQAALGDQENLRYRVEVLVFRHNNTNPSPETSNELRAFLQAFELNNTFWPSAEGASLDTPYPLSVRSKLLEGIRSRLNQLEDYEPLVDITWEQSQADYHPAVRIHDAEPMIEELRFSQAGVWLDLEDEDPLRPYLVPLYRLDGTVQLRRSRFLHLDIDLEYRIDNPAELQARPLPEAPPGFTPVPMTTQESPPPFNRAIEDPLKSGQEQSPAQPPVFRIHTLTESRQIRTNQVHYFDSPYLGVLARVTSIADTPELADTGSMAEP